jgi:hypothetical protein
MNAAPLIVRDYTVPRDGSTTPCHVLVISYSDDPSTDTSRARAALEKGAFSKQARALDAKRATAEQVADMYGAAQSIRTSENLIGVVDLTLDAEIGERLFRAGIAHVVDGGVWAIPLVGEVKGGLFSKFPSERQPWLPELLDEASDKQDFRTVAIRGAVRALVDQGPVTVATKEGDGAEAIVLGRQKRGNGVAIVDLRRVYHVTGIGGGAKAMGTRVAVSDDSVHWRDIRGELSKSVLRPRTELRTRYLRVTGTNDPIEARVPLADTYSRLLQKVVIARRVDGLGGRLAAVLNAMRLARLLGVDYTVGWDDRLADDAFHPVPGPEGMFHPAWWEEHGETEKVPALRLRSHGELLTLERLQEELQPVNGFIVPKERLETFIDAPGVAGPYSGEFEDIHFAAPFAAAIDAARAVPLPEGSIGVHVRSGDIVYGPYRRYLVHTRKVIAFPVARAVIEALVARGEYVVVFGEDDALTAELIGGTPAVAASSLLPADLGVAERALADTVLLSRMSSVVARDSAFAQFASMLSGLRLVDPAELADPADVQRITEAMDAAETVDPLVRAFAHWSAYYLARDDLRPAEAIRLLEAAEAADPHNALFALARAAVQYDAGETTVADATVESARRAARDDGEPGPDEVFVLRMGQWFLLDELHPSFERAAAAGSSVARSLIARRDAEKSVVDEIM